MARLDFVFMAPHNMVFGPRNLKSMSPQSLRVRLQVYQRYLLWALKYINGTYVGLFGAPGFVKDHLKPTKGVQGFK